MAAAIKMDELLVAWLSSDGVYESILGMIESHRGASGSGSGGTSGSSTTGSSSGNGAGGVKQGAGPLSPTRSKNTSSSSSSSGGLRKDEAASEENKTSDSTASSGTSSTPPPANTPLVIPRFYNPQEGGDGASSGSSSRGSSRRHSRTSSSTSPAGTSGTNPTGRRRRRRRRSTSSSSAGSGSASSADSASTGEGSADGSEDGSQRSSGSGGSSSTGKHKSNDDNDEADRNNNDEWEDYDDAAGAPWSTVRDNPVLRQVFTSGLVSSPSKDNAAAAGATAEGAPPPPPGTPPPPPPFSNTTPTNPTSPSSAEDPTLVLSMAEFMPITKEVCRFPSFFNAPLYRRIRHLCGPGGALEHALKKSSPGRKRRSKSKHSSSSSDAKSANEDKNTTAPPEGVSYQMFQTFWIHEMEGYDAHERFFRLVKQPTEEECMTREDFLPLIQELLATHPGLEFLSNHAEFQEKYAVTVITRIFYCVSRHGSHNGKITLRQVRRSNLLEAFYLVDAEEDINKVTQYFSYEHFYVLYCRFWELDHDRDYLITREDLLKYGDHSLSHMIVDRIFEAAPRPFESSSIANVNGENGNAAEGQQQEGQDKKGENASKDDTNGSTEPSELAKRRTGGGAINREYLSYEDFIFFMLSEEDKANEISVRYWFTCIDVDGDGRLNNMEMRSFYAVQLHRMQCLGHEIVPFEDMLCQMMDMIKPQHGGDYLVVEDFLQPECAQVSGALFDALFNLNKYLQFEQRDPFMERQKREDEFDCDWDRFACIDYNRLAMEEEAREEEAMEIDWVTVDDEEDDENEFNSLGLGGAVEAPF